MHSKDLVIEASNVSKRFKTYENKKGTLSFLRRRFYYKQALDNVSFNVSRGEIVALLGRNGSGKSTMIKLMSGILHPDSGTIRVLGMDPWKERIKLAMHISVIFGATHPQLFWDLPPIDTFEYIRELYGIDKRLFKKRLNEMIKLLGVKNVYKRQTRQLSLGERMKCEFVAAMLNMPEVVFMDEPTIGVDLPSRIAIRNAVVRLRKELNTTFVLTTHVVDDISNADRIILLDKGHKLFDGTQHKLKKRFGKYAVLELYSNTNNYLEKYSHIGRVLEKEGNYIKMAVDPKMVKSESFTRIFSDPKIIDYRLSEPGLSSILENLYARIDKRRSLNE